MNTRCLIVDDEPLAIKLIKNHLNNLDDFSVLGEARNALEALKILENHKIDLIFLDINMPKITGIELLKSLQNPPRVIIISAHKEYAIDGFDLDVVDYLLKPISFDRFLKAVNKYKMTIQQAETGERNNSNNSSDGIISIKNNKKIHNIKHEDILYVESLREYVKIHTTGDTIMVKCALNKIEESLPADLFIRIHKSFIIAIKKVELFTATYAEINKQKIPIGRNFKSNTIKTLSNLGDII
ncbi:MAG: response regulator transcription factor [Bacteroidales bacterium]|jgi:DNA-binding LytR/AlgR family response regulator|nr:response regulator transcription factor [Bacteroidales bacterium]